MSLRRLLGGFSLSAAAYGHLRRFPATAASGRLCRPLSTAASPARWAMVNRMSFTFPIGAATATAAAVGPPTTSCLATPHLFEPPSESHLQMPAHLIRTSSEPDPDSGVTQELLGIVSSSSADGLLLLTYWNARQCDRTGNLVESHVPDFTYLVCNPVSGEVFPIPDTGFRTKIHRQHRMGILAQADRSHGSPDRFAVAQLYPENMMLRYLSETGKWDLAEGAPGRRQHPLARRVCRTGAMGHEVLSFGGRLWWVNVSCGAMSVDPFSERARTDTRFVELPNGRVLPEVAGVLLRQYRRMGVSEGRMRYAEVSLREPFVLSSFALDEEGGGWTLEHEVALSKILEDGGHPWLPLEGEKTPQIAVIDPSNANVIHITVREHVVAVDMNVEKVIAGPSPLHDYGTTVGFVPCMLPPWLGSSRIPGKKDITKKNTLADVLVRSDRHQKK